MLGLKFFGVMMHNKVFCKKLKKEALALKYPPLPGALGEKIINNISEEGWQIWLAHQTKLINEYRLNLRDKSAIEFINKEMQKFLFEEEQ